MSPPTPPPLGPERLAAAIEKVRAILAKTEAWRPLFPLMGDASPSVEEMRAILDAAHNCATYHKACTECGAMHNFIGQGLFECWKCTALEARAALTAAEAERLLLAQDALRTWEGKPFLQRLLVRGGVVDLARRIVTSAEAAGRSGAEGGGDG